jgi:hypothetical protein
MGIRVHKVLGYGLTDLALKDPRVNWDSPLLAGEASAREYYAWLEARREASPETFRYSLDWALLRHDGAEACGVWPWAVHDAEYGLPGVMVVRPPCQTDWFRYDDPIDYMTETYPWSERSQTAHVQVYRHGPFPFNGFYMDARDGRRLPDLVFPWWQIMNTKVRPEKLEDTFGALDMFAREMGFAGQEEAKANVVPEVPEEIRDLAEFGRLFPDSGTWLQLRPLLYTWWG